MTKTRGAIALLASMTVAMTATATAQTQTAPVRGLESLQPQANAQAPASATPIPIPPAPTIVLPAPANTQAPAARNAQTAEAEAPRRRAASSATSRDAQRTTAPAQVRATSRPDETAPAATPTPEPAIASSSAKTPSIVPAPVPAPSSAPAATVVAPETGRAMPFWLWLLVIPVVVGALWLLRRPRRGYLAVDEADISGPLAAEPAADAPVAPVVATPATPRFLDPRPAPTSRARLAVELRPLRAGLNMLSATVECELLVTNAGDALADRIRIGVALFTAHAGQDADLARFNDAPVARSVVPPFALAPGESRSVRAVAAIPRDAIRTMSAAGRPMFVPILAANLLYATADTDAQTARAWAIGIERVDSPKLAPFWLDAPARMYAAVAARPHAAALER